MSQDCEYRDDVVSLKVNMQNMQKDITDIKQTLHNFVKVADERYVNKFEFDIVKKIVYACVGLGLLFIANQLLTLIKHG